jgi:hypothetical protein
MPNPFISSDGTKRWYNGFGMLHRENGPAIDYPNSSAVWYINGKLHREDGPAVSQANGHTEYWLNGKLHRENGPAYISKDGSKQYWLNGIKYNEDAYITIQFFNGVKLND